MDKREIHIEMIPFKPEHIVPQKGTYLLRAIKIGEIGRHPYTYVESLCEKTYNYRIQKFQTRHEVPKEYFVTHISKNPLI